LLHRQGMNGVDRGRRHRDTGGMAEGVA